MSRLQDICQFMEALAPLRLAEDWDNVGLLVGDPQQSMTRIMTCLTITPSSAAEAIRRQAELVITHHPLPFRATKRITADTTAGKLLWDLIRHGVAIYSAHTAFDSAALGINQRLATALELTDIRPLRPLAGDPDELGSGRVGYPAQPATLADVTQRLKTFLGISRVRLVGDLQTDLQKIAIGCGSGGAFLPAAQCAGCDLLVTGEANFHTCLEAQATDVALLLVGHFASERFALEQLAGQLADQFPQLEVWASQDETDPLQTA